MDFNQNNQNDPNNKHNWDRWNSNASNSSYYNQPTHRPFGQAFLLASCLCGFLSITLCCTGVLTIPIGALGILFSLLAFRKNRIKPTIGVIGIILSSIGLLLGMVMVIYSFIALPTMLKNEEFRAQLDMVTEQMYDMDFAEFMESSYGYSIEE